MTPWVWLKSPKSPKIASTGSGLSQWEQQWKLDTVDLSISDIPKDQYQRWLEHWKWLPKAISYERSVSWSCTDKENGHNLKRLTAISVKSRASPAVLPPKKFLRSWCYRLTIVRSWLIIVIVNIVTWVIAISSNLKFCRMFLILGKGDLEPFAVPRLWYRKKNQALLVYPGVQVYQHTGNRIASTAIAWVRISNYSHGLRQTLFGMLASWGLSIGVAQLVESKVKKQEEKRCTKRFKGLRNSN